MRLSGNVEASVELNKKIYMSKNFIKGIHSGMTEYVNLELSGNDKGDDQKSNICMLPILLQLLPRYFICNIARKLEPNQKTLCACKLSKECISRIDLSFKWELSENT